MSKVFLYFIIFFAPLFNHSILLKDIQNFYSITTYEILLKTMIPSAFMANSSLDRKIYDFYEQNMRSNATNSASKISKLFGSNRPLFLTLATLYTIGLISNNQKTDPNLIKFVENTTRSIIVGLPLLIFGQNILGGDRPYQNTTSSWYPLKNDHAVSGHTYMGAIPFISAANLSTSFYLKFIFYAGSILTGLSRINDGSHYPSQVILGWALAFTSCTAILKTNQSIIISADKVTLGYAF